ncbi:dolichyl-diphosphooligosaccharide--protein glycosyltransferase subunit 1A-like [Ipomoea triloba]|uniref:dolichyl-diphosphooligosaccharide--protein glycosyltransferase subunit 1A-like n=1 Tax=Ipomoea triloba TaxID=35885 RepID=UPI00125D9F44|nr:dolichyl-diphosphooligosaccharide--protein glycosyltransferase subunit 1A-like [Ipomoea triloba]
MRKIHSDLFLFIVCLCVLSSSVLSDLIISKADRKIDLTSQIVRSTTTLKVENSGNDPASEVLLPFPDVVAKNLSFLRVTTSEGKEKK